MPNMKALALTVWDKKIFKVFSFGCHGNQSSSWNSYLWSILKVHHPRIISVKFHWNLLAGFREDFLSNCSRTDTRMDAGRWLITMAHPEHIVLRWAKKRPNPETQRQIKGLQKNHNIFTNIGKAQQYMYTRVNMAIFRKNVRFLRQWTA